MGKDLHRQILDFFMKRVNECDKVVSCKLINNPNYHIVEIKRTAPYGNFKVCLCDEYFYTYNDYASKPSEIKSSDFLLIAKPEANFSEDLIELALFEHVYIGKMKAFIKYLHSTDEQMRNDTKSYVEYLKKNKRN